MVSGLKVTKSAVALTFTTALDKAAAEDLQNYKGERWNYKRTSNYGSPEFSAADPEKKATTNSSSNPRNSPLTAKPSPSRSPT